MTPKPTETEPPPYSDDGCACRLRYWTDGHMDVLRECTYHQEQRAPEEGAAMTPKPPTRWQRIVCWLFYTHRPYWRLNPQDKRFGEMPPDAVALYGAPDCRCVRCGHEW